MERRDLWPKRQGSREDASVPKQPGRPRSALGLPISPRFSLINAKAAGAAVCALP